MFRVRLSDPRGGRWPSDHDVEAKLRERGGQESVNVLYVWAAASDKITV